MIRHQANPFTRTGVKVPTTPEKRPPVSLAKRPIPVMHQRRWGLTCLIIPVLLMGIVNSSHGQIATGSNTSQITINDSTTATPYASGIALSGVLGTIQDVRVTLKGFTHTWPSDVSIMLVSPAGKAIVLMSGAGGGNAVSGIDIGFRGDATLAMTSSKLLSRDYLPSHFRTTTTFPAPAPTSPSITSMFGFNGNSPNGTWKLYVKDDAGDDVGKIANGWSLTVITVYAPIITSQPLSQKVNLGASVTLTSAVNASPAASLQWRKNGVDIPGQTGTALVLTNFQSADAGSYTLFASNAYGTVSSNPAVLTLNQAPTISAIADQTINEDTTTGPLAFTIADAETAASDLTVSVSSSNTTLVPSAGLIKGGSGANRTVSLTPAANQFGTTTVTISVSDGTTSTARTFQLNVSAVNDPPTISAIAPQTVNEDSPTSALTFAVGDIETPAASLTVDATSSNPALLPPQSFVFAGSGSSRTVTITPAPNGFGTANITLSVGDGAATTSTTFPLTVNPVNDPPTLSAIADQNISINQSTGNIAIAVGDVETPASDLVLSATGNNGALLPLSSFALGGSSNARTLNLTPAAGQSGQALITVSLTDGAATVQRQFNITVYAGPAITSQPIDRTIATGTSTAFSVTATGFPLPGYQWKKDNVSIGGATNTSISVSNAAFAPPASYTCVITNSVGSVTSRAAVLTVLNLPTITTHPLAQTGGVGSPITFSVTPGGSTPFTYQWRKDGSPISQATGSNYTIPNLLLGDAGNYSVVLSNPVGSVTSSNALLTVLVPPAITIQPQGNTLPAESSITLAVTASGSPTLGYQWKKEGNPLSGKTASSLTLSNLTTANAGSYTVTVTNQVGTVTSDAAVVSVGPAVAANWQWKNPLPAGNFLNSVAYGSGKFVAAGEGGNVMSSSDGENWTLTPGTTLGVIRFHDGTKFLGSSIKSPNGIASSTDGVTWTEAVGTPSLSVITGSGGQLVGAGSDKIWTSSTGFSWAQRFTYAAGASFTCAAYGGGRYVVAGTTSRYDSGTLIGNQAVCVTSTNSTTWSSSLIPNQRNYEKFVGVIHDGSRFVGRFSSSDVWYSDGTYTIKTSTDGLSWTDLPTLPAGNYLNGIRFLNGRLYAFGYQASGSQILTSADASTWSAATLPADASGGVFDMATNGSKLVAVGGNGLIMSSVSGDTWALHRSGKTDVLWHAALLENGEFWAVGNSERVLRSLDRGDTWVPVNTGLVDSFSRVLSGNGVILLATSNKIYRSTDGLNFTQVADFAPYSASYGIGSPSFCNGQFLVYTSDGLLWSSSDASTWSSRAVGTDPFYNIIYSKGYYIAQRGGIALSRDLQTWTQVTSSGRSVTTDGNTLIAIGGSTFLLRSTDGLNWTSVPTANYNFTVFSTLQISYGAGSFVAIGSKYISSEGRSKMTVVTSPDGLTWTERPEPYPSAVNVNTLTYGAGRFIAVGDGGSILTSASTERPPEFVEHPASEILVPGGSITLRARVTAAGAVSYQWLKNGTPINGETGTTLTLTNVAAADAGAYALRATSNYGVTTGNAATIQVLASASTGSFSSSLGTPDLKKVIYTGNAFMAVGGRTLVKSTTGDTWTQQSIPLVEYGSYSSVAFGGGRYVVVGSSGYFAASSDSSIWTVGRLDTLNPSSFRDIAFGNGRFVAVGDYGQIATSTDGLSFTAQASGVTQTLYAVAYGNGLFTCVGLNGRILTSPDGLTWTSRNANEPISAPLTAVTYANSRWMAAGYWAYYGSTAETTVLTSTDGVTWTRQASGNTDNVEGLAGGNGSFLACSQSVGLSLSSSPYTSWPVTLPTTATPATVFSGVAYGGGRYVAVGYGGLIASSPTGSSGTWTYRNNGSGQTTFLDAIHTGSAYYATASVYQRATGSATGQILTSSNGQNWTVHATGLPIYSKLAQGNGYLVAYGTAIGIAQGASASSGARYFNTAGGGSWQTATINSSTGYTNYSFSSVAYGNGVFLALAAESPTSALQFISTNNGASWNEVAAYPYADSVAFIGGQFVITGGTKVYTTVDGVTRKEWNSSPGASPVYGNGRFVSISSTTAKFSSDGIVWSSLPLQGSAPPYASRIYFGNGQFFSVGGSKIATSLDGVTWSLRDNVDLPVPSYGGSRMAFGPNQALVLADGFSTAATTSTSFNVTTTAGANGSISPAGSTTIAPGGSLIYTASPNSYYIVDKWTVDGQVVQTGGLSYTLPNIQGNRSVAVSFVLPQGPPQILPGGNPSGGTINAGQGLTLSVNHIGNPASTYQWRKDGIDIPGATQGSYTIANASPSDAGSYSVVLTNLYGTTTSWPVAVLVNYAPVIGTQPQGNSYLPGANLQLGVAATAYPSSLTYQWKFNGSPIAGKTQSTLDITNFQAPDAGDYAVTISNSYGSTTSEPASLSVGSRSELRPYPGTLDKTFRPNAVGQPVNGSFLVQTLLPMADASVVVGGNFDANDARQPGLTRLSAAGLPDLGFSPGGGFSGTIFATAKQSDGRIIVVGAFTSAKGVTVRYIARLNADGSLDPSFNSGGTGANNAIYSVMVDSSDRIYIGGAFTTYNGQSRARVARLTAAGALDTTFLPGSGANSTVFALALASTGEVYLGGDFSTFNGTTRKCVARLLVTGALDTTFSPLTTFAGSILALYPQSDGKLVIGGLFSSATSGLNRGGVARLNANGTHDVSFASSSGTGFTNTVRSIRPQADGKLIIGGDFTSYNGTAKAYLARVNADGSLESSFPSGGGPNSVVTTVSVMTNGDILIGGQFTAVNGTGRDYVAKVTSTGAIVSSYGAGTTIGSSANVSLLLPLPSGKSFVAGSFTNFNGGTAAGYAQLLADGSLDPSFIQGTNSAIGITAATRQPDGKIVYGTSSGGIVRLNADGSADAGFNLPTGGNAAIRALANQTDGSILAGGEFTSFAGSSARRYLVRLSGTGVPDDTLAIGAGPGGFVRVIKMQPDGKALVGGGFASFNGAPSRAYLTRLLNTGAADPDFTAALNGAVTDIDLLPDGRIFLSGDFTTVGGVNRSYLSRLLPTGAVDTTFAAPVGYATSSAPIAAQSNGKLLCATTDLLRFDLDGNADTGFNAGGPVASINALRLDDQGRILISGTFSTVGGIRRSAVARLYGDSASEIASIVTQPTGRTVAIGETVSLSVVATGSPAPFYQWRKENVDLSGKTGASLTLNNVQAGDLGNYTVFVSNLLGGVASQVATLTLNTPPTISPLTSITVLRGQAVMRIPFLIGDAQTPSTDLGVAVQSSDSVLLPSAAIVLDRVGSDVGMLLNPVSAQTGQSVVTVTVNDGQLFASRSLILSVLPPSLPAWKEAYFTPEQRASESVAGDFADPNGNGLSNLLEYALGGNPLSGNLPPLPSVSVSGGQAVYSYVRPKSISDVDYTVEFSSSGLSNWGAAPAVKISETATTETWQAVRPATNPSGYFRLKVNRK